ncbi:T9SS type A sorting domain-containing protein [Chryseobacterium sp. L7]|uniref:T9SS type A sorting domain-containing protein n=1 Tax=Chryseobacterium endalhagicum TaxID=2797638 RepID=A0ABS1QDY8_9FLAO|nr:GEVED domain-containing protein [Chryseobacterium endalhagicum]MBL1220108.1 T9SS type A sorting domain-containing protein [Chryseobacterium endalhagicum]
MIKNLLFMFLFFSGAAQFQAASRMENICEESAFTVPTNLAATNITFTSAHITWDPIPGATGYTVRWRVPSSAVWSSMSIPAGTTSADLNNLTPCVAQIVQVIDNASGDVSFPLTFYTHLNYCRSYSTSLGTMYLSNVKVTPAAGLPAMVCSSAMTSHTDFRPNPTYQIQLGVGSLNNILSVTPSWTGAPLASYVKAWIDFNANAIFEASEMIVSTTVDSTNPKAFIFNVPSDASITQCGTAMRVIISETEPAGPCELFMYGEVEDYGVTFVNTNLAVDESAKTKEISIYPNPVSDVLHISGLTEPTDYEIFSVSGQKAGEGKTSGNTLNVSHLTKGIYFIQLKNKETPTRLKFIKK